MTNWNDPKYDGPRFAENMPEGDTDAAIIDRVIVPTDDKPMMSRNGDPQIRVIWQDEQAREASTLVTLGDRGVWVLKSILNCMHDPSVFETVANQKLDPERFVEPTICESVLVGQRSNIRVTHDQRGDRVYANAMPIAARPDQIEIGDATPAIESPKPKLDTEAMKKAAWQQVVEAWKSSDAEDANAQRNAAFKAGADAIGKPVEDFTQEDWNSVVDIATREIDEIPF